LGDLRKSIAVGKRRGKSSVTKASGAQRAVYIFFGFTRAGSGLQLGHRFLQAELESNAIPETIERGFGGFCSRTYPGEARIRITAERPLGSGVVHGENLSVVNAGAIEGFVINRPT
jgi:hypothetical protein